MLEQTISIYIHFPWCISKCYYCDFNSYPLTVNKEEIEKLYLEKVLADLEYSIDEFLLNHDQRKLLSIFFGGGTPSLLSSKSILEILERINKRFQFTKDLEISLEVNPGTLEQDCLSNYKDVGITRISLGAQSFQNDKLQLLGRIHNVDDIKRTIDKIIKYNFNSFNLDLMYGLPQQNLEDALYDLSMALSYNPMHISWYQLTVEPNTLFYNKPPKLPDEGIMWEIYTKGLNFLKSYKYTNYEISAFARDHYYCKHNLNYWQYGDYLGIGPGAHSKISKFNTIDSKFKLQEIIRLVKIKSPKRYLETTYNSLIIEQQKLSKKEIIFEFMLNNLRLRRGFTEKDFFNRTGCNFKDIKQPLKIAIAKNLVKQQDTSIKTTKFGRRFLNDLQELFLE